MDACETLLWIKFMAEQKHKNKKKQRNRGEYT